MSKSLEYRIAQLEKKLKVGTSGVSDGNVLTKGEADLLYGTPIEAATGGIKYKITALKTAPAQASVLHASYIELGVSTPAWFSRLGCWKVDKPSTTANTFSTMYERTGAGLLDILVLYCPSDTTSRTMSVKVTIDGTLVINKSTDSRSDWNQYAASAIGAFGYASATTAPVTFIPHPMLFHESIKIEVASTVASDTAIDMLFRAVELEEIV